MPKKISEAALDNALVSFRDAIKGWSCAGKDELGLKIVRGYGCVWALKEAGGPHKKALAELKPLLVRQSNLERN